MAISKELNQALQKAIGSPATISRKTTKLAREYGPMTADEARWVVAHDANIDLRRHNLTPTELDRVRELRAAIAGRQVATSRRTVTRQQGEDEAAAATVTTERPPSPAALFDARQFHTEVVRTGRRLFVDGHYTDAIRKAFQRLNNRAKRLTRLTEKDGPALMGEAFRKDNPPVQMSDLKTISQRDEHEGTRFLMMGAMSAMRNPRSHEDSWEPDRDPVAVLEALSFASMLHRFLDRCEAYRQTAKP